MISVDGNDISELRKAFKAVPEVKGKPTFIIANTVKGKGVSFMEGEKKWHHGVPSDEQYAQAMKELNAELKKLESLN